MVGTDFSHQYRIWDNAYCNALSGDQTEPRGGRVIFNLG